jgi:hypothetical protein
LVLRRKSPPAKYLQDWKAEFWKAFILAPQVNVRMEKTRRLDIGKLQARL